MGSSILHGGMSTFMAVIVMSQGKLYSVVLFFRIWVCIIGYGLLNGLVLLPIVLSFIGPVDFREQKEVETPHTNQKMVKKGVYEKTNDRIAVTKVIEIGA